MCSSWLQLWKTQLNNSSNTHILLKGKVQRWSIDFANLSIQDEDMKRRESFSTQTDIIFFLFSSRRVLEEECLFFSGVQPLRVVSLLWVVLSWFHLSLKALPFRDFLLLLSSSSIYYALSCVWNTAKLRNVPIFLKHWFLKICEEGHPHWWLALWPWFTLTALIFLFCPPMAAVFSESPLYPTCSAPNTAYKHSI